MIKKVSAELEDMANARDEAIKLQREIVPWCAQAIRDVQKKKFSEAEEKIKRIEKRINETEKILKKYPEIVNSVLGSSYQEYAELKIFLSYLKEKKLPKINVPSKYYLLGLGDAIGELKREGMEMLAVGKEKEAERLYEELEDLYYEFSQYVYPNSIVPGLKQKQDVARMVLNKFREQIIDKKLRN